MHIEDIINYCIANKTSLRQLSLIHGKNPSYYSNLINAKHPDLKHLIKNIPNVPLRKEIINIYDEVVNYIEKGYSTTQISKTVKLSNPTILKLIRYKGDAKVLNKLTKNNNNSKIRGLKKSFGHAKGRSYEQIYGSRAKEMKEKRKKWLKENNIRVFNTKISKPQKQLYEIVLKTFPTAILDYKVIINDNTYYLDIAVPELFLNIEYDGSYWHDKKDQSGKYSDITRDINLKNAGWKIYRLKYKTNPKYEKLVEDFNSLNIIKN